MASTNQSSPVVVFDNGSKSTRVGIAKNESPDSCFPTVVAYHGGRPTFVSYNALLRRNELEMCYPVKNGLITDWDSMEKLWEFGFYQTLRLAPENHPVILTEAINNPRTSREKMTQIMFETFNCPAVYIQNQAVLSLYCAGRVNGVVVESGDGVTQIVPVDQGHADRTAIHCFSLSGRDLTDYMMQLLNDSGHTLEGTTDLEIARDAKERCCYVAANFEQEIQKFSTDLSLTKSYKLPDGRTITTKEERCRCPEALFRPSLINVASPGLHERLNEAIQKCAEGFRKTLYANIVLGGGSTLFTGLEERLKRDVCSLAPPNTKVDVIAKEERKDSAWIGGSILGSLTAIDKMSMTKKEYDEHGPVGIHTKCT